MKKILLSLLIAMALLFSGCIDSIKLNDQAIVQAVSIDLIDDGIKVGLQIFSPSKSGEGKIGASTDNAKIIESTGKNISEAFKNANLTQGKQIFTGHNRIIVIGQALAEQGMTQLLNFFSTNALSRKNVSLVIAEGEAIDIIKSKLNQGMLPADTLEKIIINTNKVGYASQVLLYEFERSLTNQHDSAILPVLRMEEKPAAGSEEKGDKKEETIEPVSNLLLKGSGIITHGGLVDILNEQETRGVLWIRNNVTSTTISTTTKKIEFAAVEVFDGKTKITPKITGDMIEFNIEIICRATLGETIIKEGVIITDEEIIEIQNAASKVIVEECHIGFNKAIIENKSDVFNFGNMVWKDNVELWRKLKDNWLDSVDNIKINVKANVDIDSIGLEYNTEN